MNREDFPILSINKDLIYFDNGATTLKPKCVVDEVTKYYTVYTSNAHRGDSQQVCQSHQRRQQEDYSLYRILRYGSVSL